MIALKMVLQIVDGQTNGHTLVVVKSLPRLKNLVLVSRYLRLSKLSTVYLGQRWEPEPKSALKNTKCCFLAIYTYTENQKVQNM